METRANKGDLNNNKWFQGLTPHKIMPSSSQIKKLSNRIEPIHANKLRDCFKATASREDRITARETKAKGDSFIVKIHSPENPVWKIPGFCYLEVGYKQ